MLGRRSSVVGRRSVRLARGVVVKRTGLVASLASACLLLSGCTVFDMVRLASDDTAGRQNDTAGSATARAYLIDQLRPIARGLNPAGTGDAAYTQPFSGGRNVVALIPGTDLADEYVVVGAHYDGLGTSCNRSIPEDQICNGATDNATGVAAALAVARSVADRRPRRSVVIALWDREEDGLLGARHYVQTEPLVPLAKTVGYVNFDIQGANLLPSLRNNTIAIAAESGGSRLTQIVSEAIGTSTLDTAMFSSIFGQNRSDYVPFLAASIPTVFFSDATGPCYHTVDDEITAVDFPKLDKQIAVALNVTRQLANTSSPPAFVSGTPLATYDDLVEFWGLVERGWADRGRFSAADQTTFSRIRDTARRLVAEGRAAFGSDDVGTLLGDASTVVSLLTRGTCEGFQEPTS